MLHIINQNNYLINEKPSTKPSTIDSLVRPTMDPGCARSPDQQSPHYDFDQNYRRLTIRNIEQ